MSFTLDLTNIKAEEKGFQLMPVGEYELEIVSAEISPTQKGGKKLAFKYKVNAPEKYNKRFVWDNLNIENANKEAQGIALGRIKKMMELAKYTEEQMKATNPQGLIGNVYGVILKHNVREGYKPREEIAVFTEFKGKAVDQGKKVSDDLPF